jgi:peptide/nickel transport system substrate-binding protein
MRRRLAMAPIVAMAAIVALAAMAGGCAKPSPSVPAAPLRPLRIALYADPLTLDPYLRNELLTFSVLRNIYEALTAFDAGTKVGPALAESWENPNELTWIFHLRRGVHFHDGSEFTARDVLFSFDCARNAQRSNVGGYLVAIDRITALDAHTVQITTRRPYPILLNKLAFIFIVPAGAPSEIRQPVGTGPYRLAAYQPGKRLSMVAYPAYWGGAPFEPQVDFLPVADVGVRIQRLLAGDVDIVQEPGPENVRRIVAGRGCRVIRQDSLGVTFFMLRRDLPPFSDERVRRAIYLALDRPALVGAALYGEGVPVGQMVGRNVFGFAPDILPPAADAAAARALLSAAGHPDGVDLLVTFRQGRAGEVAAVERQLRAAGIRLHPEEQQWVGLFPRILAGDVAFYFGGWFCLSGDASDFFDSMVHSRDPRRGYGANNYNHYANPALDTLIEESGSTLDLLARRAELERSMRVLMRDLAFIPLYSPSVIFGARDNVEWQPRRDGLILADTIRRTPAPG